MKLLKLFVFSLLIVFLGACQTDKKPASKAVKTTQKSNKKVAAPTSLNSAAISVSDALAMSVFPKENVNLKEITSKDIEYKGDKPNRLAYHQGKPFSGRVVTYLGKTKKLSSETLKDGRKSGPYQIWHTNGNPNQRGTIYGTTNDGLYREWYLDGSLKYEYHYDKGKKNGVWRSWYENGQQWTHRDFINDILHGKIFVWDTDGTLTKEMTYQNGNLIDKRNYFEE